MIFPDASTPRLPAGEIPPELAEAVRQFLTDPTLSSKALKAITEIATDPKITRLEVFHNYAWILVISFFVTLCVTPIMRKLAVANGVIDRPTEQRKVHRQPIAYLGGAAVFTGMMAGIVYSFLATIYPDLMSFHPSTRVEDGMGHPTVPVSILLGMTVIALIGLLDDVVGISPRVKISGQLFAAAALAIDDVGVQVAKGVLEPIGKLIGNPNLQFVIPLGTAFDFTMPFTHTPVHFNGIPIDVMYWTGTAIIGVFVLGACNASNLIDGLDGLLTGTTAITSAGLLVVALGLCVIDDGPRDAQRIILCMALLGACLGFLPHNFNPATIFLGDCGSLLLGFTTIVIILTLGDTGKTQLVIAGLIIYAVPLIDTTLAIVRRKMAGKAISDADSDHLHHMLKRAVGVKGAVLTLYAIATGFAVLGVTLTLTRVRVIYILALILASYIGVTAIKIARKKQIEEEAARFDGLRAAGAAPPLGAAASVNGSEPGAKPVRAEASPHPAK